VGAVSAPQAAGVGADIGPGVGALGVGADNGLPGVGAENSLALYEKSGEAALYAPGVRAVDEGLPSIDPQGSSSGARPGVFDPASQALRSESEMYGVREEGFQAGVLLPA